MNMTISDFLEVLQEIKFPGFEFHLGQDGYRGFLQIKCKGTCNVTGQDYSWSGRKWLLSPHMTPSEIVNTALKAVLTAIEHEAREKFTYKGVTIYDPHTDVEELVKLRQTKELSFRGLS